MNAPVLLPSGARSVMASRREPPDSLDFFPTPPWATRALIEDVLPIVSDRMSSRPVWDPCCGEGHMAEVLREYFKVVHASDVFDYGRGYAVADFLDPATNYSTEDRPVDLIAMNPPFNAAVEFALRALELAPVVAILARTSWLEGESRFNRLFGPHPLTLYAPFVERVPMVKGRWDPGASTANAYAWFVWIQGIPGGRMVQIPAGRRRALTGPTDALRFCATGPAPLLAGVE